MTADTHPARVALAGTRGAWRGEVGRWLGWRGLIHLALWLAVIGWILSVTVTTKHMPFGGLGFESLMNMLAVFPPLAGIVLTAAAVCGGYHDGTTAWVLSKPVPRPGYLLSVVSGIWLGLSVTAIVVPAAVAYVWLPRVEPYRFVTPEAPPLGRFVLALAILSMVLLFFVSLTAFLSVVIRRRSVAALLAALALLMLRVPVAYPGWYDALPARLIRTDLEPGEWSVLTAFIHGDSFDALTAVWGALGLIAVFALFTSWVFRRLEL